jgi:hypothetical protein
MQFLILFPTFHRALFRLLLLRYIIFRWVVRAVQAEVLAKLTNPNGYRISLVQSGEDSKHWDLPSDGLFKLLQSGKFPCDGLSVDGDNIACSKELETYKFGTLELDNHIKSPMQVEVIAQLGTGLFEIARQDTGEVERVSREYLVNASNDGIVEITNGMVELVNGMETVTAFDGEFKQLSSAETIDSDEAHKAAQALRQGVSASAVGLNSGVHFENFDESGNVADGQRDIVQSYYIWRSVELFEGAFGKTTFNQSGNFSNNVKKNAKLAAIAGDVEWKFGGCYDSGIPVGRNHSGEHCSVGHPIRYVYTAIPKSEHDYNSALSKGLVVKFGIDCVSDFFKVPREQLESLAALMTAIKDEVEYISSRSVEPVDFDDWRSLFELLEVLKAESAADMVLGARLVKTIEAFKQFAIPLVESLTWCVRERIRDFGYLNVLKILVGEHNCYFLKDLSDDAHKDYINDRSRATVLLQLSLAALRALLYDIEGEFRYFPVSGHKYSHKARWFSPIDKSGRTKWPYNKLSYAVFSVQFGIARAAVPHTKQGFTVKNLIDCLKIVSDVKLGADVYAFLREYEFELPEVLDFVQGYVKYKSFNKGDTDIANALGYLINFDVLKQMLDSDELSDNGSLKFVYFEPLSNYTTASLNCRPLPRCNLYGRSYPPLSTLLTGGSEALVRVSSDVAKLIRDGINTKREGRAKEEAELRAREEAKRLAEQETARKAAEAKLEADRKAAEFLQQSLPLIESDTLLCAQLRGLLATLTPEQIEKNGSLKLGRDICDTIREQLKLKTRPMSDKQRKFVQRAIDSTQTKSVPQTPIPSAPPGSMEALYTDSSYSVSVNGDKIFVNFKSKPEREVLTELKRNKFWWDGKNTAWVARKSDYNQSWLANLVKNYAQSA